MKTTYIIVAEFEKNILFNEGKIIFYQLDSYVRVDSFWLETMVENVENDSS